jgi:putative Ca2+/H+ antiporter (TMEM165/GDT1 family)
MDQLPDRSRRRNEEPGAQPPHLGPTSPATLIVAGLAAAALAWLLVSGFYGDIPALPFLPAVIVAALAVLEGFLAFNTKARIERRPGHDRVDPLAVARYVVLAKASSLAGSIFAGFYAGALVWLLAERSRSEATSAISHDTPRAIAGVVAALALVATALWLERSCRVPKRPEDEPDGEGRRE